MNNHVMDFIEEGGTLIAANNRLAHHLRYRYAQSQINKGLSAWKTPDILPWSAWLQRLWEKCSFHHTGKLLLDPVQELALWQHIISRSKYAGRLLQTSGVARRAAEAWSLSRRYQIPLFPSGVFVSEDAFAFKSWADAFKKECDDNGWLDNATLPEVLALFIKAQSRVLELNVALSGFEEITPQQTALFRELESAGAAIRELPAPERNDTVRIRGFADGGAEIWAAANWARHCLENDPEASIGIVVPDLNASRSKIISRFEDVLSPGALTGEGGGKPVFSLSLGKPLSSYPLAGAVFSILALGQEPVALTDWNTLLRTPFIKGAAEEQLKRAMLDAKLRSHGEISLNIETVLYVAGATLDEGERPVQFLHLLKEIQVFRQNASGQKPHHGWAEWFSDFLKITGWPGDRTANSAEYQCLQAWRKALARFVSLQMVTPVMNYATAVTQLRRIAGEFSFQPETEETPIQILGMEGSAAMAFDYLWIMGLHEEDWPPPARPNPFIPIALQKQFRLPNATADIVLSQAQKLLNGIVNSAGHAVLSYPQNEQERVLRPSPLLKNFRTGEDTLNIVTIPDYLEEILSSRETESFTDEQAPPLAPGEFSSGGTALFKDQSACHFRALSRHRLHAVTLDQADIGLDARERGSILHRIMQNLWLQLGSQKKLLNLGESGLDEVINGAVDDTINTDKRRHPKIFTERFTALEKARLKFILREWLQLEKERAPFTVIATEEARPIAFEGLQVNTRVDRIDELENGQRIIIDYKTGKAGVNEWAGERPDDPQLPLYAVTHGKDIAALAFARLKRGDKFGYEGLANEEGLLPGVQSFAESSFVKQLTDWGNLLPTWDGLFSGWEKTLKELATSFREGCAEVNPKNAQTCSWCDQQPFCRIYELSHLSMEETEEQGNE